MGGTLFPPITDATAPHVLHRWVAAFVGVIVAAQAVVAWRTQRDHPTIVRLAVGAAILYAIQVLIGGAQVLTELAAWTQTLHLALGGVIWAALTGLTVTSYYTARVDVRAGSGPVDGVAERDVADPATPRTAGDTIRAYIALTKPRSSSCCWSRRSRRWCSRPGRSLPRSAAWTGATGACWSSGRWSAGPSRRAARTPSTATSTATSTCS
jgi:hypothetical protein